MPLTGIMSILRPASYIALDGKRILLIVGGGIAAYKACDLLRQLRGAGASVRCVLTEGASQFVTPMTFAALSEQPVHTSLWDLKDEAEMGHIRLSREADLIVVAPATANLIARMASGIADDLATTLLLATDKPVLVAPAMNVRMWTHPATRRNIDRICADGVEVVPPESGAMACGEWGEGRLADPAVILERIGAMLSGEGRVDDKPLAGRRAIVTAGPTHEPIDPVRVIANRSSGKQGFAIAAALAEAGADVTLIAGPVALATPPGVQRVDVETALEMQAAVNAALPAEIAVMVAAIADWRVDSSPQKLKKHSGPPNLVWHRNPDLLADLAVSGQRPRLLIGFAAETGDAVAEATGKRLAKGADWILANNVAEHPMGGTTNRIDLIHADGVEPWPAADKAELARRLVDRIVRRLDRQAA